MKDGQRRCRKCGREIMVIEWGVYRKVIVDPEAVWIIPSIRGEEFVRIDGSKVRGEESDDGCIQAEPVYRMHRKTCGVDE